jgi:hypothetical protein
MMYRKQHPASIELSELGSRVSAVTYETAGRQSYEIEPGSHIYETAPSSQGQGEFADDIFNTMASQQVCAGKAIYLPAAPHLMLELLQTNCIAEQFTKGALNQGEASNVLVALHMKHFILPSTQSPAHEALTLHSCLCSRHGFIVGDAVAGQRSRHQHNGASILMAFPSSPVIDDAGAAAAASPPICCPDQGLDRGLDNIEAAE